MRVRVNTMRSELRVRSGKTGIIGCLFAVLSVLASADTAAANTFIPDRGRISAPTGARSICATYRWACASSSSARTPDLHTVSVVSRNVNRATREVSDEAQYRQDDLWTLPTRRGGDCEDFALLKKKQLIGMGYDPDRLLLTTVLDRKGRSHAVLVVRTDEGDFVLDNLTDKIRRWNSTGYTFLRMQDPAAPHRWLRLNVRG